MKSFNKTFTWLSTLLLTVLFAVSGSASAATKDCTPTPTTFNVESLNGTYDVAFAGVTGNTAYTAEYTGSDLALKDASGTTVGTVTVTTPAYDTVRFTVTGATATAAGNYTIEMPEGALTFKHSVKMLNITHPAFTITLAYAGGTDPIVPEAPKYLTAPALRQAVADKGIALIGIFSPTGTGNRYLTGVATTADVSADGTLAAVRAPQASEVLEVLPADGGYYLRQHAAEEGQGYLACSAGGNFSVVAKASASVWTIAGPGESNYGADVNNWNDLYSDIAGSYNDYMVRFITSGQYMNCQGATAVGGVRPGTGAWSFNYVYNYVEAAPAGFAYGTIWEGTLTYASWSTSTDVSFKADFFKDLKVGDKIVVTVQKTDASAWGAIRPEGEDWTGALTSSIDYVAAEGGDVQTITFKVSEELLAGLQAHGLRFSGDNIVVSKIEVLEGGGEDASEHLWEGSVDFVSWSPSGSLEVAASEFDALEVGQALAVTCKKITDGVWAALRAEGADWCGALAEQEYVELADGVEEQVIYLPITEAFLADLKAHGLRFSGDNLNITLVDVVDEIPAEPADLPFTVGKKYAVWFNNADKQYFWEDKDGVANEIRCNDGDIATRNELESYSNTVYWTMGGDDANGYTFTNATTGKHILAPASLSAGAAFLLSDSEATGFDVVKMDNGYYRFYIHGQTTYYLAHTSRNSHLVTMYNVADYGLAENGGASVVQFEEIPDHYDYTLALVDAPAGATVTIGGEARADGAEFSTENRLNTADIAVVAEGYSYSIDITAGVVTITFKKLPITAGKKYVISSVAHANDAVYYLTNDGTNTKLARSTEYPTEDQYWTAESVSVGANGGVNVSFVNNGKYFAFMATTTEAKHAVMLTQDDVDAENFFNVQDNLNYWPDKATDTRFLYLAVKDDNTNIGWGSWQGTGIRTTGYSYQFKFDEIAEEEEPVSYTEGDFYVKNEASGKYFGFVGTSTSDGNFGPVEEADKLVCTVTQPEEGTFNIQLFGFNYVSCGSNGGFSNNKAANALQLFKVNGSSAVKATTIEEGAEYLIVGNKNGTDYALSNGTNGKTGADLRTAGIAVTITDNTISTVFGVCKWTFEHYVNTDTREALEGVYVKNGEGKFFGIGASDIDILDEGQTWTIAPVKTEEKAYTLENTSIDAVKRFVNTGSNGYLSKSEDYNARSVYFYELTNATTGECTLVEQPELGKTYAMVIHNITTGYPGYYAIYSGLAKNKTDRGDVISLGTELPTSLTIDATLSSSNGTITPAKALWTLTDTAEDPDQDELAGKSIENYSEKATTIQPNTWYVLTQTRNGETPAYDSELGGQILRAAVGFNIPKGANAEEYAQYLIRLLPTEYEGTYYMQWGNGNYWGASLNSVDNIESAGMYKVYNINGEETHFGINVTADGTTLGQPLDNNGAGQNVAFWGSGEVKSLNGNNDWKFYPVELGTYDPEQLVRNAEMAELVAQLEKTMAKNNLAQVGDNLITEETQFSSNYSDSAEGKSFAALIDENATTFWHTDWHSMPAEGTHPTLEIELAEPVSGDIQLTFMRRNVVHDHATGMQILTSTDGTNYTEATQVELPFTEGGEVVRGIFNLPEAVKYLSIYALNNVKNDGTAEDMASRNYWHAAELQLNKYISATPLNEQYPDAAAALQQAIDAAKAIDKPSAEDIAALASAFDAYNAAISGEEPEEGFWVLASEASAPVAGKTYALKNVSRNNYASNHGVLNSFDGHVSDAVWTIETTGNTVDGAPTYYLYNKAEKAYWKNDDFEGNPGLDGYDIHNYCGTNAYWTNTKAEAMEVTILAAGSTETWRTQGAGSEGYILALNRVVPDGAGGDYYFKLGQQGSDLAMEPWDEDVAWYFYEATIGEEPVGPTFPLTGQPYLLKEKDSGMYLNVIPDSEDNKKDVVLKKKGQDLYFTAVEGGYTITTADGLYVGGFSNGWNMSSKVAQTWVVEEVEGGYALRTADAGKYLGFDNVDNEGAAAYRDKSYSANHGIFEITAYGTAELTAKDKLAAAIAEAKALNTTDVPEDLVAELNNAIEMAEGVLNDAASTDADYEEAQGILEHAANAVKNYVPQTAAEMFADLNAALEQARAINELNKVEGAINETTYEYELTSTVAGQVGYKTYDEVFNVAEDIAVIEYLINLAGGTAEGLEALLNEQGESIRMYTAELVDLIAAYNNAGWVLPEKDKTYIIRLAPNDYSWAFHYSEGALALNKWTEVKDNLTAEYAWTCKGLEEYKIVNSDLEVESLGDRVRFTNLAHQDQYLCWKGVTDNAKAGNTYWQISGKNSPQYGAMSMQAYDGSNHYKFLTIEVYSGSMNHGDNWNWVNNSTYSSWYTFEEVDPNQFGEIVGVGTVIAPADNALRFNVQGQRIAKDVRGINIVNGKKLIRK